MLLTKNACRAVRETTTLEAGAPRRQASRFG
jgi:hypothetical protein